MMTHVLTPSAIALPMSKGKSPFPATAFAATATAHITVGAESDRASLAAPGAALGVAADATQPLENAAGASHSAPLTKAPTPAPHDLCLAGRGSFMPEVFGGPLDLSGLQPLMRIANCSNPVANAGGCDCVHAKSGDGSGGEAAGAVLASMLPLVPPALLRLQASSTKCSMSRPLS